MKHLIGQVVGVVCFLWVMCLTLINGAYMLFAPRRWMTSERWYFFQGNLRLRRRYRSGEGDWELRFLGAMMLGVFGYFVWNLVIGHASGV